VRRTRRRCKDQLPTEVYSKKKKLIKGENATLVGGSTLRAATKTEVLLIRRRRDKRRGMVAHRLLKEERRAWARGPGKRKEEMLGRDVHSDRMKIWGKHLNQSGRSTTSKVQEWDKKRGGVWLLSRKVVPSWELSRRD